MREQVDDIDRRRLRCIFQIAPRLNAFSRNADLISVLFLTWTRAVRRMRKSSQAHFVTKLPKADADTVSEDWCDNGILGQCEKIVHSAYFLHS